MVDICDKMEAEINQRLLQTSRDLLKTIKLQRTHERTPKSEGKYRIISELKGLKG